jgi:flavodoxin I
VKKLAIVYHSLSGNTREIAEEIRQGFHPYRSDMEVDLMTALEADMKRLQRYDALIFGTYTWGNGELPEAMKPLYLAVEENDIFRQKTTGVFGSGDKNYPHFCRAVDLMADMLAAKTRLVLKMKVELNPKEGDIERCRRFARRFAEYLRMTPTHQNTAPTLNMTTTHQTLAPGSACVTDNSA